ncbi:hypothetical protein DFJ58DRAFT_290720 [Suillus subalutaceus]|uniref:uncharacterized protein n=1 Tax=Suillus subalutaceus TaxID=48586 RepID=UPI001B885D59|nr:uncharacterized protein DFJ58DRAFT_290720 [Suillus subalutaceus]KAG1858946.1 hypothetical protein DFJ58DRAFT_290720 [Suillus subalutaceus]
MGSSTLDSNTSSPLSPPGYASQMLILPVSDPLLYFLASSLLNHGKRTRTERIVSRTLLYIHVLTCAPSRPILCHALTTASPAVKCLSQKRSGKNVVRLATLTET